MGVFLMSNTSNILKKPYEISIWDDILVFEVEITLDGSVTTEVIRPDEVDTKIPPNASFKVLRQFYKENKIAIIGSDNMSAPWRAVNPFFTQNVNGSLDLTFTMYAKYYDEDRDSFLDNPFTKTLVNERKVKLKYDNNWYDFIIKSIQESSDNKTYTYIAKSLFINELSKTGYDLIFDSELENNLGTIDYLADQILDGSDWRRRDGDIIRQYKEEPLYLIKVAVPFTAKRMLNLPNEVGSETINLRAGDYIYGFYQSVNSKSSFFQFLYRSGVNFDSYPKDDNRIIINTPNYYIEDAIDSSTGNFRYFNEYDIVISNEYRGNRLVRNVTTKYDPVTDKYVTVYRNDANEVIYGYTEYEYLTSNNIRNYITNPIDFTSTDGWRTDDNEGLNLLTIPQLSESTIDSYFKTYIKWSGNGYLLNSCITVNRSLIKSFAKDEKYTLRFKYGTLIGENNVQTATTNELNFYIAPYEYENGKYKIIENKKLFTFLNNSFNIDSYGYFTCTSSCAQSASYDELLNNNYVLIIESSSSIKTYCIEELQLFKYAIAQDGSIIYPNTNITSETKTKYIYYKYDPSIKDANLIVPIYQGYTPADYITEYNEDCEKQRSIKASESNRFNLIQSLCETFECWAKFEIEHNQNTGEILLDETGRQKKWISFHEYVGKDNYIGFKYGINLKSIQRTLDSEAIVSKMIVKNNSNEYAKDGFCSIARADENPTGENFLLDFSHYINQGLLEFSQFNNDLYSTAAGYLGYYQKLKKLNSKIEENSKLQAELVGKTLPQLRSQYSALKVSIDSGNELYLSQKEQIYQTTNLTLEQLLSTNKDSNWWNDNDIYGLILSTVRLEKNIKEYEKQFTVIKITLNEAEAKLRELKSEIEEITKQKEIEHAKFYKKYSRYIQEGAWTSEDYIDENLYYLDSVSTLHTSSQPKVTYTINVIELSQVEGFELYNFEVGDKTFIEDTEFFGWIDTIHSTPYKEEVVVTEVKYSLDDPSQNTITIKNYKTQFEDLFQRITAITTSVQFSTGEYQRAAGIVNADGTLDASAVQNSISNNALILSNSNNESIIWDSSGLTTTSISKPNVMVRIVGGGVFLSKDFGTTWSTGITGEGINANYINAGQIDTNLVRVMNGSYPTFRWDSSGLSAYYFEKDLTTGQLSNYSQSKFVRLDQYGLYGINSDQSFDANKEENGIYGEDKIHKHSKFYLTWSGFGIKTDSGAVSITSDNEFQVFADGKERIKIGTLDQNEKIYGMRLFDDKGNITLETGSDGQLYLQKTIKIAPSPYTSSARTLIGPSVGYDKDGNITDLNDVNSLVYSKIFSVNNIGGEETIAFYDNGLLEAYNARIAGTLEAGSIISDETHIGGENGITIGNLSSGVNKNSNAISAIKGIDIASSSGTTFKMDSFGNVTPTSITFMARDKGVMISLNPDIQWYLSDSMIGIEDATNKIGEGISVTVVYDDIKTKFINDQCYIYVKYTTPLEDGETERKSYIAYRELNLVRDGAAGQDAITYKIESTKGFIINSSDSATPTETILTAHIYKGETELDMAGNWTYTWYDKTDIESDFTENGSIGTGKQIQYDLSNFNEYTQIYFTVEPNE